jgi:hypothetical protein
MEMRLVTHLSTLKVEPTISSICKVFGNLHMPLMGTWFYHHPVTNALVGQNYGSQLKSDATAGLQMMP